MMLIPLPSLSSCIFKPPETATWTPWSKHILRLRHCPQVQYLNLLIQNQPYTISAHAATHHPPFVIRCTTSPTLNYGWVDHPDSILNSFADINECQQLKLTIVWDVSTWRRWGASSSNKLQKRQIYTAISHFFNLLHGSTTIYEILHSSYRVDLESSDDSASLNRNSSMRSPIFFLAWNCYQLFCHVCFCQSLLSHTRVPRIFLNYNLYSKGQWRSYWPFC